MFPVPDFTAAIAQLVRAQDCDSWGRGFESRWPPHFLIGTFSSYIVQQELIEFLDFSVNLLYLLRIQNLREPL